MAPTNDQFHSVVEEKEYKPGKFLPTNKAQETEGFQIPGIRLKKKQKPISEASPLRFRWGGGYKSDLKALNSAWSVLILWDIGSTQIQV